jgi:hypothetical protein
MSAVKDHFTTHPSHLLGCGVAALLVIAAIVFGLPILAIFGSLMCGAMMIMMVWMMAPGSGRGTMSFTTGRPVIARAARSAAT